MKINRFINNNTNMNYNIETNNIETKQSILEHNKKANKNSNTKKVLLLSIIRFILEITSLIISIFFIINGLSHKSITYVVSPKEIFTISNFIYIFLTIIPYFFIKFDKYFYYFLSNISSLMFFSISTVILFIPFFIKDGIENISLFTLFLINIFYVPIMFIINLIIDFIFYKKQNPLLK